MTIDRRAVRIVAAWAVLWALVVACGTGEGGGIGAAPAPTGPAVPVDACAVQDAYQSNEVAARQSYPQGQHVLVSGTVDNVGVMFGTTTVHPRPCIFAMINLADDQTAAAAALQPGQAFSADCTTGNYGLGIAFDNCRLQ